VAVNVTLLPVHIEVKLATTETEGLTELTVTVPVLGKLEQPLNV
jgi:hypothetical protein